MIERNKKGQFIENQKTTKNCLICNKKFYTCPSKIKQSGSRFCSIECRGIWQSKNVRGKNHHNWKGKVKQICLMCKKEFLIYLSQIKHNKGKFCSHKCYISFSKGNKHWNWKGGISPVMELIRHSQKYQQWRSDVFIRDNFTCQKCGAKSGNGKSVYLEAHHKKPFHKLLDEVKNYLPLLNLYDGAMAYTPLWNLDNGITYCKKCHYKTRTKKG